MVNKHYKKTTLAFFISLATINCYAENIFNPAFLSADPDAVADLSRFQNGNQAPGQYRVDIWVNDIFQSSQDVTFVVDTTDQSSLDDTGLRPQLPLKMVKSMGLNVTAIPELTASNPDATIDIARVIPGAHTEFAFDQQRLNITVPQVAMLNTARGYIPPSRWDEGITALMFNYTFSGSDTHDDESNRNYFLGLNSGFNYGPWRLRDYATWNYSDGSSGENHWNHINTYLERAIIPLRSELVIGDSTTPSDVFDSIGFRGVQLASDDTMLPDSLRGFAPVVRGIAKSHAQVTIKQNGYTLYQTYVPPGAFEINDLFPTSSSGDLVVQVKEADGSVNVYTVPYSSVPVLQREGHIKYALTAGDYRSNNDRQDSVGFVQSTLIYGLPAGVTAYGGTQLASQYKAFALGLGINVGQFGAISADVTQAKSRLIDGSDHSGASLRFLYAKSLNELGTNFQLLGYRYSTEGFYTLEETTWKKMSGFIEDESNTDNNDASPYVDYYNLKNNKRAKFQVNVSQQLGQYGSIYLSGSRQSYWKTNESNTLLQAGYSGNLKGISWNVSYSYNKIPGLGDADKRIAFGFSFPLSLWLSSGDDITQQHHEAYASYNFSHDQHGNASHSAGINGTLLEDNNLNYSVQQGYQTGSESNANGAVNIGYDTSWGSSSVGYNYSDNGDYQQLNYSLRGGIVIHDEGITFSQPLGDTNVLIAAPGAKNVKVDDVEGLKTDWRGYAVVPFATTYRRNRMSLDTTNMPANVELEENVVNVVPTRGALVRAEFNPHVGARALINLTHNGKPLPFGTMVSTDQNSSIVGDAGQAYLSGLSPEGDIVAKWGAGAQQACTGHYRLPEDAAGKTINTLNIECR
ncbi:fimbrial biogenesis usher protein [Enterobacter sp. E-TC7]|uniref:Fimbrial biogenesis usher protein n=1 Tax=Enterobacter nematophilus TaxID=2994648 RepID=A0ABT3VVB2_9ENTR|nr:fimbrial biogenesis usher protein [Enterobacter nematophilus]MCX5573194.1 fimbrial biogenesis usher protein [Enterobacter nematophilus]